jgi:pSer/pThr/pTyr-binding forkhead associated (FHA) protein
MAFLRVRFNDRESKEYCLKKGVTSIGRRPDNDIMIDSPDISNRHARLNFGQNCYLTDLRSSNGTYINGEKILHSELSDGDKINFAGTPAIFYDSKL